MSTAVWQVGGLGALGVALIAAAAWILFVRRISPEKQERRRRLRINERGRLGEGIITDFSAGIIYYSYGVGGVEYCASQDVTRLSDLLPPDPDRLIGAVKLKYLQRNPANSILICETWSGLKVSSKEIVSK